VREAHAAIEALGARVIAVGTGSAAQARHLMDTGTPFPCLVDADRRLYRALGLRRVGWSTLLDPATYLNYWRAWRRGARQGDVTGDPRQLSGVALLDADGRLRWRHVSRTIGDYPSLPDVLAALRRIVRP
jgi:alkyl-hydroperoxide reductase/thiol specific antioxidant family protein